MILNVKFVVVVLSIFFGGVIGLRICFVDKFVLVLFVIGGGCELGLMFVFVEVGGFCVGFGVEGLGLFCLLLFLCLVMNVCVFLLVKICIFVDGFVFVCFVVLVLFFFVFVAATISGSSSS